ncbi:hypothetical protein [Streptomyces sp. LUP30]|uniref:hypothetical protein n=1 Tax=Streptomyces sp. LUP30 TaxID=1890285 RepID=UPI00159F2F7E|nr:hypothetical protein [Streptomyces sp. LUP30]
MTSASRRGYHAGAARKPRGPARRLGQGVLADLHQGTSQQEQHDSVHNFFIRHDFTAVAGDTTSATIGGSGYDPLRTQTWNLAAHLHHQGADGPLSCRGRAGRRSGRR